MEYYQLKAKAEMVDRMFKMGEQARQAEIDELQERIDRAVEHIEDYYGVVGLSMVVDILKGEETK